MRLPKLSRGAKALRNGLIALALGLLLFAQWQFPPFTARGMCREVGRELLMTTPKPVFTRIQNSTWAADRQDAFVVARSGDSWVSFQYERTPMGLWQRNIGHMPLQVSQAPHVSVYGGTIYLIGLPEEPAAVDCAFTLTDTVIWRDEDGSRSEPEFGPSRDFTFSGYSVADGVWAFDYHDPALASWAEPDEGKQAGDLAMSWYRLLNRQDPNGYGTLHVQIPLTFTLSFADGQTSQLTLAVENYQLGYV